MQLLALFPERAGLQVRDRKQQFLPSEQLGQLRDETLLVRVLCSVPFTKLVAASSLFLCPPGAFRLPPLRARVESRSLFLGRVIYNVSFPASITIVNCDSILRRARFFPRDLLRLLVDSVLLPSRASLSRRGRLLDNLLLPTTALLCLGWRRWRLFAMQMAELLQGRCVLPLQTLVL